MIAYLISTMKKRLPITVLVIALFGIGIYVYGAYGIPHQKQSGRISANLLSRVDEVIS